jgi:ComF family protein
MKTPLLDLFLPRTCIVCGRTLLLQEREICIYCLSDLPLTYNWLLTHHPMADRFNAMIQRDLPSAEYEPYAYAAALFRFSSQALYRRIPYALKYSGNLSGGRFFAEMLGRFLSEAPHLKDADLVIPVPLHFLRRWRRGYNQAEILARGIASVLQVPCRADLLVRSRRTGTQIRKAVEEKKKNVSGAFSLRRHLPEGIRHILLVDDVFTTGATLNACYRVIREAYPAVRISVATLSVVG